MTGPCNCVAHADTIVRWEDPPCTGNRVFTAGIIDDLRSAPGRWAVIRDPYRGRGGAPKHPVDVDVRVITVHGRAVLYARADPPVQPAAGCSEE